jgi:ankyrin repeat protein
LKLLAKGKGHLAIDELDNVNQSTPLMVACEILSDLETIKILVAHGCDVNSVNSDDKMPLSIIKERLDKHETQGDLRKKLEGIYEFLESRGAKLSWK